MTWQILTLISVVTFSVSVILRKVLLRNDKIDPFVYTIVFQGLVGLISGIFALINGFVMPDFSLYWFPILMTCVLYGTGHVVSAIALKKLEASIFSILFATSAVWTMVTGSILFGESLTWLQLIGVILTFVSILMLVERKGVKSLKSSGLFLGLATGLLFGLAATSWVYVARHADTMSWNAISFIGPALVVALFRPKAVLRIKSSVNKRVFLDMLILSAIFCLSSITSMIAYKIGNVNLVTGLRQSSTFITAILGIVFLKERSRLALKLFAAGVCFIALLLLI